MRVYEEDEEGQVTEAGYVGEEFEPGPDLGPDERDLDLMDGSWEADYYAGRVKNRDWNGVYVGMALLILMGILVPAILVLTG